MYYIKYLRLIVMCLNPLKLYKNKITGKYQIKYEPNKCDKFDVVYAPCRKCAGCLDDRKGEFGLRFAQELQYYEKGCFLTLTVNDNEMEKVFPGRELSHRPFQLFMKRFRKWLSNEFGENAPKIKYMMCGEYGSKNNRPHYHAYIFGFDFYDLPDYLYKIKNKGKYRISAHKILDKLWKHGFASVGTGGRAAGNYIAKYVIKQLEKDDISFVDSETGELKMKKRPYMVYPRGSNGGLGYDYYKDNVQQMFEQGCIKIGATCFSIPRYYKRKCEEEYPELYEEWKKKMTEAIIEEDMLYAEQNGLLVTPADVLVAEKIEAFKLLENPKLAAIEILKDVGSLSLEYKSYLIKKALFLTRESVFKHKLGKGKIAIIERKAQEKMYKKRIEQKFGKKEVL